MANRQQVQYEGTAAFVLLPGLLVVSGDYWTLIPLAPAAHAATHVGADSIQDATGAQKGLMTAAFATKLNGIEALADVTANHPPQAHAASHAAAGADPVTLTQAQITNLVADLAAKLNLSGGSLTGILNSNSQLFLTGLGNLRLGIGFGSGSFSSANAVIEAKPHASSRLTFYDNINGAAHNPVLALCCLAVGGRGMALFADTTSSAFIFDGAGNFDVTSDTQANIRAGTFGTGTLRLRVTGAGAVEVPSGGSLSVGGGTALTKAVVYTPNLTPAQVVAAGFSEQTFAVAGLTTGDTVTVNGPAPAANSALVHARVSAADTLALQWHTDAAAITPSAGIYRCLAIRS